MRDEYSFRYNDVEPKNSHGCCTSILTWRDHAYFMARLETGWWAASHFHDGRVEILTATGGVKRCG
ncbi:MAG: hypothetical protein WB989_08450 [Mycobacterium sp.]